jgi:hypothetical protein
MRQLVALITQEQKLFSLAQMTVQELRNPRETEAHDRRTQTDRLMQSETLYVSHVNRN